MKALFYSLLVISAAATACGSPGSPQISEGQETISADPRHWMVGTWDCTAGYHNTPPFKVHQALATYTVTEDDDGVVHGQYKEMSGDAELISFEDEWSIGSTPVDSLGNVAADLKAAVSDGSLRACTIVARLCA